MTLAIDMQKNTDYRGQWQKQHWDFFSFLADFLLEKHQQRQRLSLMISGAAMQIKDPNRSNFMLSKALRLASREQDVYEFI